MILYIFMISKVCDLNLQPFSVFFSKTDSSSFSCKAHLTPFRAPDKLLCKQKQLRLEGIFEWQSQTLNRNSIYFSTHNDTTERLNNSQAGGDSRRWHHLSLRSNNSNIPVERWVFTLLKIILFKFPLHYHYWMNVANTSSAIVFTPTPTPITSGAFGFCLLLLFQSKSFCCNIICKHVAIFHIYISTLRPSVVWSTVRNIIFWF